MAFSVTRPLLAVIISSVSRPCVLANHTTASRKHKGKMHEQARPCVFFVSDVCSLRTQNLKLTEEMDHNSKQRKERTTEKYRTNEVQKKHPFLNLQKNEF